MCVYKAFLGVIFLWKKDGGKEYYSTALGFISSSQLLNDLSL